MRKDQNRLIPEDKGRLVTIFLMTYFARYVGLRFHRRAGGRAGRHLGRQPRHGRTCWRRFWRDFSAALAETSELRITEVLDKIDEVLAPHLYPPARGWRRSAHLPELRRGQAEPEDRAVGRGLHRLHELSRVPLHPPHRRPGGRGRVGPDGMLLGHDQGDPISLSSGRFGPYVQRGEATEEVPKPPRASLPKGWEVGRDEPGKGAAAAQPAAPDRPAPRGWRDDRGRHRPLWTLRQARPHLCQPARGGRGVRDRHEPCGRGAGARRPPAAAGAAVGPGAAEGAGRPPRRRPAAGDGGPLWPLHQVGQDQRHPAQGDDAGDRHASTRRSSW